MESEKRFPQIEISRFDRLNQVLSHLKLSHNGNPIILGQILFFISITWLPSAILAYLDNVLLENDSRLSYLLDYAAYSQFLLSVPALIVAQSIIGEKIRFASRCFVSINLIRGDHANTYELLCKKLQKLIYSWKVEILLLILGYIFTWSWLGGELKNGVNTWHAISANGTERLTMAGWWEGFIGVPLFNFWWLRWVWKSIIWTYFLKRVSSMELNLTPEHPDQCGGLAFLQKTQASFGLFVFAFGVVVAATAAYKISVEGTNFASWPVWSPLIGFLILAPSIFIMPLIMFSKKLRNAKNRMLEYLSMQAVKNLSNSTTEQHQKVVDTSNTIGAHYQLVEKMRVFPFDLRSMSQLFGSALTSLIIPIFPLIPQAVDMLRKLYE